MLDLKLAAEVIGRVTGCLEPQEISKQITDGLVETFGCAFARIWLVLPDRRALRLMASSGLYTRVDGDFAQVPMGSFKIGKIAQNCIPFLSNCLPEESWVKDRQWAIDNGIQGFVGLPLMAQENAIGVLAIFSKTPINPGVLEVLQLLSLSVAGTLSSALTHQSVLATSVNAQSQRTIPLSEQLAAILGGQKLSMLGNEQRLSPVVQQLLIEFAKRLSDFSYRYCRLVYEPNFVVLETVFATKDAPNNLPSEQSFANAVALAERLGGSIAVQSDEPQTLISVRLQVPRETVYSQGGQAIDNREMRSPLSGSPLSEREQEVIQLLAAGLRDRDIAEQLYISVRTVKFHTKNILTKLNVNTRIQAVFEATKKGWLY
ncbi:MAG: LuxR C-terminal-related transcriptional regulator [Cyanobacteria bacterium J06632_3]